MLKTILILPDGREVSSGPGTVNAIRSASFTQPVNESNELSPGSVCAAEACITLFTPAGGLPIQAGDQVTVLRQDEAGQRHPVGIFIAQKPTRPSANTMKLTAYDRVSLLDKDLTGWLASLDSWPYKLSDFASMVCAECGVGLAPGALPNGDYPVEKFSGTGITGRKLIRWAGQIAGRFCRAKPDGELEFAWYTPREGVSIGPRAVPGSEMTLSYSGGDMALTGENLLATQEAGRLTLTSAAVTAGFAGGDLSLQTHPYNVQYHYYQGGLAFEDYAVAPVDGVCLRRSEADVGTSFPETAGENPYTLTANPLLSARNATHLLPVAEALYAGLKTAAYTPCRVRIAANMQIRPGDILPVVTPNGRIIHLWVMKKTQSGQQETLECTGSPTRQASAPLQSASVSDLSGKVLELELTVDGLRAENRDAKARAASMQLTVDGITAQVEHQQSSLESTKTQLTRVEQDAKSLSVQVRAIQTDGVSRVQTTTGYTFGADGLRIQRSGEEMENRLDHTGMYVTRMGQTLLQANNRGVTAADVTVRNYLVVGDHARLEDYAAPLDPSRTACFFV